MDERPQIKGPEYRPGVATARKRSSNIALGRMVSRSFRFLVWVNPPLTRDDWQLVAHTRATATLT